MPAFPANADIDPENPETLQSNRLASKIYSRSHSTDELLSIIWAKKIHDM